MTDFNTIKDHKEGSILKNLVKLLLVAMALADAGYSKNVNWRSLRDDQRNIVQFNSGYDYGVTAQVAYNRSLSMFRPVVVGLDFSVPMGNVLLDDFKVRLGGQMEIVDLDGFSTTIKIS